MSIIVAIDTTDLDRARQLIGSLADVVAGVKLGLEFFSAHGVRGVQEVVPFEVPLFLDLKLHDIPNTVSKAIRALDGLPIWMLTVHTSGGAAMMRAAKESADFLARNGHPRPMILGVTILTSLDGEDLEHIGFTTKVSAQVERLALLAEDSGLDGVVCSPHEIAALRRRLKPGTKLVVPGIRPAPHVSDPSSRSGGIIMDDQKRVMTPTEALSQGANYLVIGRPITEAENPREAVLAMQ